MNTGAGELVKVGDVPIPAQKHSPLFRIPRPVPEVREWRIKQVAAGKRQELLLYILINIYMGIYNIILLLNSAVF